jgi:sialate O-acetylesterase
LNIPQKASLNFWRYFSLTFKILWFVFVPIQPVPAVAQLSVADIISDGAVLQRGRSLPIWGEGVPRESVKVEIQGVEETAVVSDDGSWRVTFPPLSDGGPFEMTVSGSKIIKVKNLMVGEVWICGGQSNMSWTVGEAADKETLLADADPELIRLFRVPFSEFPVSATSTRARWQNGTTDAASRFSAVCYAYGKKLQKALGIPVGLINVSYPSTRIEAWLRQSAFTQYPQIVCLLESFARLKKQLDERKLAEPENLAIARRKIYAPGSLFNGMVEPIVPFANKGVIWYQGEGNTQNPFFYELLLGALVQDWRVAWRTPDLAFVIVQLPGFGIPTNTVNSGGWAGLREAQLRVVQKTSQTVLVPTLDLGSEELHPPKKFALGERAALTALAKFYGRDGLVAPTVLGVQFKRGTVRVSFDRAVTTLRPNSKLDGFALAGADRVWYQAAATAFGTSVEIVSDRVMTPVAVRYGWANQPIANLASTEGLPASPFRSDLWPLSKPIDQMLCN